MVTPPIRVERHASSLGRWEMARRAPLPQLRDVVLDMVGWEEATPGPLRRREVAIAAVPLIVSFGPRFVLLDATAPDAGPRTTRTSFVAGLHDGPSVVEHAGESRGVEVRFTPLGARRVLGPVLAGAANEVVELEDLLGAREAAELVERLAAAPGWAARFALLDALILARLAREAAPAPVAGWAWRRLAETGGTLPIGALAREIGCSRRHLVAQVRGELGLPPKPLARVLRFERAVERLGRSRRAERIGDVALACGYSDQAHLNRDFRALAGVAPTAFLASRLPDGGGVAADAVTFVQDGAAAPT